ncbi:Trihelix transcription factor GT-3a [Striga hermonthica]|uniref:Trihelix transcription factor GT-3a n=1 Tax=Striga hermonthica TaxID=68872 RepID=A0A9N7NT41_STRHE|nr:Trihelix transcription factor GT-3a [Striga hermonthica]
MDHHQGLHGHHHHHHLLHHQYSAVGPNIDQVIGPADNRLPQWSLQETQDFLVIRAELDQAFMETKRNKLLWEVISARMKEKGHNRSAEQCKCKWKNLVTRYKGCETMEVEGLRQQFPFYNELQTIFAARMQRMLWHEAETGGGAGGSSSRQRLTVASAASQFSSDEEEPPYNEDVPSEGDKAGGSGGPVRNKKRKAKASTSSAGNNGNTPVQNNNNNSSAAVLNGIREMMEEYMRQQMLMEARWIEAYERHEVERRAKEAEWRETMQALENERLVMESRWREREAERREREEQRSQKRDALINALLNKLRREEGNNM